MSASPDCTPSTNRLLMNGDPSPSAASSTGRIAAADVPLRLVAGRLTDRRDEQVGVVRLRTDHDAGASPR